MGYGFLSHALLRLAPLFLNTRHRNLAAFTSHESYVKAEAAGLPLAAISGGGHALTRSVDILQRLPTTQRTQTVTVESDISLNFRAVSPGILTQRPAYRLLEEEFL